MNTQNAPTIRAFVSLFLLLEEPLNPIVPYELQVLNRAHIESGPVPLVKLPQLLTGIVTTLETVLNLVIREKSTSFLDECTILIPYPAASAGCFSPASIHSVPEVGNTYSAVHAAGCNELLFHDWLTIILCS